MGSRFADVGAANEADVEAQQVELLGFVAIVYDPRAGLPVECIQPPTNAQLAIARRQSSSRSVMDLRLAHLLRSSPLVLPAPSSHVHFHRCWRPCDHRGCPRVFSVPTEEPRVTCPTCRAGIGPKEVPQ